MCEITKELFYKIVSSDDKVNVVINRELFTDIIYKIEGVTIKQRVNHASGVIQHFIIDINC